MNNETGNSCPMPSCPDNYGAMPSCAGLAVPYVPFQQTGSKQYSQNDALSNGTLFPGLNLPFHLKVEGSALPSTPLVELQALEFVVLELGTYLDTHPDDICLLYTSPPSWPPKRATWPASGTCSPAASSRWSCCATWTRWPP